ncbi:hypothetical protein [Flindersiella endophytica]
MSSEPLRPGDPAVVGPFRVRGRLANHQAGVVLLAQDAAGNSVAVAVLHAAAAEDSAVRDRLAGALEDIADPEQVAMSGVRDPVPWVATTYTSGRPDHALSLLDAAALAGGSSLFGSQQTGPDFAPHWAGSPASQSFTPTGPSGPQGPSPAPPGVPAGKPRDTQRSLLILGGIIFGAIVLVIGVWWLVSTLTDDKNVTADPGESHQTLGPLPSGSPSAGPTTTSDPSETPTTGPSSKPTYTDGPPGPVAGPTYGKGEPTYLMELRGMPFSFRAPGTWGCVSGSVKGRPDVKAWVCADEAGTFGNGERPAVPGRSEIYLEKCPAPCGAAQWKKLRDTAFDLDDKQWKATDSTTRYAEESLQSGKTRLSMSHVFASKAGGKADTHIGIKVSGAPADKKTMQKLINEIRTKSG